MRHFVTSCKVHLPRKLKKAAKYGVNHYTKQSFNSYNNRYNCQEIHYYTCNGRRTKWKIKAIYKHVAESKKLIKELAYGIVSSRRGWR